MTIIAESYGRRPVPADKWVRMTLEEALEHARSALAAAEEKETKANAAATEAIAMMVLWRGRVDHLKAALAALPPHCCGCGKAHWMNEACISWPLHDEGGGQ